MTIEIFNVSLRKFNLVKSHLCSKTESVAIRKSGTGIVEYTRTIHLSLEVHRCVGVLGNDSFRVITTVFMNVIDSVIDI